jgi:hypothetical protein
MISTLMPAPLQLVTPCDKPPAVRSVWHSTFA